jgi:hypothetical protein
LWSDGQSDFVDFRTILEVSPDRFLVLAPDLPFVAATEKLWAAPPTAPTVFASLYDLAAPMIEREAISVVTLFEAAA